MDFTLRISDRGKGIPPDAMEKIWDYHFTTTRKSGPSSGNHSFLFLQNNLSSDSEFESQLRRKRPCGIWYWVASFKGLCRVSWWKEGLHLNRFNP